MDAAEQLLDPSRRDGRAVDPIAAQLSDPQLPTEERVALIRLLGRTGAGRAGQMLTTLSKRDDLRVKLTAIAALGEIGPAGQDEVLLDALEHTEPSVRLAAAIALSRVAAPTTAAALFKRLTVASEQDRAALGIALSGALSSSKDKELVARVVGSLPRVQPEIRDVLIEGLGRMSIAPAGEALALVAQTSLSVDDRRKAAEALVGHPAQLQVLRRLTRDPDPSVQANAVWGLGLVGEKQDAALLTELASHRDVAVAGNAVASLGQLVARGVHPSHEQLCSALGDARAYVKANALAALRSMGKRCDEGAPERGLLSADTSELVRERAAWLLRDVPSSAQRADARGLRRCLLDDRSGRVARACREGSVERGGEGVEPVVVFVVPDGRTTPEARVGFALILADGRIRMGLADRRGAVFEARAPRGEMSLGRSWHTSSVAHA